MDFARKQLEKYGWEEGKGLGKDETGMTTAIKPKLKYDNTGLGHDIAKDFTNNWWDNVYNNASKNIEIKKDEGNEVKMNLKNGESVEISTKTYSVRDFKKNNDKLAYGTFLRTSQLTTKGVVDFENVPEAPIPQKVVNLTDDELFAACGGRTAHKGARHGIKQSGKLSRIDKQEKLLLKRLQRVSISEDEDAKTEKKLKKLAKNKDKIAGQEEAVDASNKKKKRKKKRKSVSFSETVTEYHTQEQDTSSQSNESLEPPVILQTKIKDQTEEPNNQDEGIEQDCDMKTGDFSNQQCFEVVQKSKKEKKKKRATERFLEAIAGQEVMEKCKRKHDEDCEDLISKKRCEEISSKSLRKKKKKKKLAEKAAIINSIADSLDQVCKISDTE